MVITTKISSYELFFGKLALLNRVKTDSRIFWFHFLNTFVPNHIFFGLCQKQNFSLLLKTNMKYQNKLPKASKSVI